MGADSFGGAVMAIFSRTDILLPNNCDMTRWSVVACDQFTSEPEYWRQVEQFVGDCPSALRLMLPEAYLGKTDVEKYDLQIHETMDRYLSDSVFQSVNDSCIYCERTLNNGSMRKGIIGALDLEAYDWHADSRSPIRATEGTVADRLPPRVIVRSAASVEMPHIIVFIDDPDLKVIAKPENAPKLYDFELMQNGGHISGWQITGNDADELDRRIAYLTDKSILADKYGYDCPSPVIFAMGDGNHSLAAAKQHWENLKKTLAPAELIDHPARYALVELVNIHDPAVVFEPIHKVLFDTDNTGFIDFITSGFAQNAGAGHSIEILCGNERKSIHTAGYTIGELIGKCEELCAGYISSHGGRIDYIHGDDEARSLASRENSCGILLPKMQKSELFTSVMKSGPFPKKSFSIGHASDKRYYLECRKIR